MDSATVLRFAPYVLKRMEYGIDIFYLLNLNNDEIWTGNYSSCIMLSKLDGILTINEIVNLLKSDFVDYTYENLYNSVLTIFDELVQKGFLIIE